MSVDISNIEKIKYEDTILFDIISQFSDISQDLILQLTKELYYIKGIGISTTREVISQNLLCIELRNELVPTQFLYLFILNNSAKQLSLKSTKWVNEWLYKKDVPIQFALEKSNMLASNYYIITYHNQVVGIGEVDEQKRFLKNWHNISTYLFE